MRAKRTHGAPAVSPDHEPLPDHERPPDATGLTIDWIGVQETGGGGQLLPAWLVAGLTAVRAVPFLVRRAASRPTARSGPAAAPASGDPPAADPASGGPPGPVGRA